MKKVALVLIIIIAFLYLIPIIYVFTNSFMDERQLSSDGVHLIPEAFNLQQYYRIALFKGQYFKFFLNSLKITSIIIGGQLVFSVIPAYAFAKMRFPGRNIIFIIYVMALLLPFQVTLVPNYLVFDKLEKMLKIQFIDTHLALILPGIFNTFGVFLLKQFIREIPDEIIQAAKIDGACDFKIFFTIIIPIIRPAILSLIVLTFIDNWNILEQAIVFIDSVEKLPLSLFLETIYYDDFSVFYGGGVLYMIPAIIIFLRCEKYLREGFNVGGNKQYD
ncbi:carbohydrate ABC transporter permease [Maledivibacter halophilus]|uniref:Carbohydrate ABC transporter membrane protein 2, CUT1 family n=1 Tax=Maledivibacter halophilus TaxID=36842 RepID=A0A1T5MI92_9FIRM|nr:carbohydrate ABC transporter permease [Maledivibacter halophilus]SKC87654.1 carbohydrate ABC transporter membrane protein 2, CUT1 family [Maledivibacter halophilus]